MPPLPGAAGPGAGVLPQDRLLQGHHLRRRVDPELPGQDGAELAERAQRLALRAGLVLREGEQLPAALAQRRGAHQGLRLGEHLAGPPAAQQRVDLQLLGLQAQLVEPPGRPAGGRPVGEVGEGRPAPQGEGLVSRKATRSVSPSVSSSRARVTWASNSWRVDVVGGHGQDVAVGRRLDRLGAQHLAEPDDAGLQVLGRRRRWVVAPDRVDQLVGAHRLSRPRGQGLQYDSVVGAETSRAVDGQRTEDLDPHPARVLGAREAGQRRRIPGLYRSCAGRVPAGGQLDTSSRPAREPASPGDRHEPHQEHRRRRGRRRRPQPRRRAAATWSRPPTTSARRSTRRRPAPKGPTWDHPNRMDFGDGKATLPAKPKPSTDDNPSRLNFGDNGRG